MTGPIDATVLVLAKAPRPGRVKTRLCPPCTPVQAAAIAAAALAETLTTVATVSVRRRVVVLDGPVGTWLPPSFEVLPQVEGGLATRLAAAFAAVDGPAFLVGMDTPQLTAAGVTDALHTLLSPAVDAVMGPARDGGWWGLGLTRPDPLVFAGVPMSSPRTGTAQLARLHQLELRTRFLPELLDVDHFADARTVATTLPGSRFADEVAAVEAAIAPVSRVP